MECEGLKPRNCYLTLRFEGFRQPVFLGVPKSVDRLIGIDEVVLFRKVEIVEVICLENWLYFAVFELFGLFVDIAIGLNDGAVSLALTEQDKVLLSNRIKRFAVLMAD